MIIFFLKNAKNASTKKNEDSCNNKIQKLDFFHWFHCNCGCYYCSYRDETKGQFSDEIKKGNPLILDTLKLLYKNNIIDTEGNLSVVFGGGELGVLEEFPDIIDLLLKNNVSVISCESSGVRYSTGVEKILKNKKGAVTVAVCSGDAELYKKIKNRDKYDQVMDNLHKYVTIATDNEESIVSKFIILPGMNNKKEEIEKWLLESKRIGLKHVEISMEFCWGIHQKKGQIVEYYNYELFNYTEKRCKELGLLLRKNGTSMDIMRSGVY